MPSAQHMGARIDPEHCKHLLVVCTMEAQLDPGWLEGGRVVPYSKQRKKATDVDHRKVHLSSSVKRMQIWSTHVKP